MSMLPEASCMLEGGRIGGRDLTWFSLLKFFLSLQRVYKEMAQFIFFDVDGDTLWQNQLSQETAKGWQGEGHLVI